MSKVVPGPKIFFDWDQNFFLDRDRDQNIFDWNPHPKFVSEGTGTGTKIFFSLGPGPGPNMTGPAHVYIQSFMSLFGL